MVENASVTRSVRILKTYVSLPHHVRLHLNVFYFNLDSTKKICPPLIVRWISLTNYKRDCTSRELVGRPNIVLPVMVTFIHLLTNKSAL